MLELARGHGIPLPKDTGDSSQPTGLAWLFSMAHRALTFSLGFMLQCNSQPSPLCHCHYILFVGNKS